jgi:hypothetical protein
VRLRGKGGPRGRRLSELLGKERGRQGGYSVTFRAYGKPPLAAGSNFAARLACSERSSKNKLNANKSHLPSDKERNKNGFKPT